MYWYFENFEQVGNQYLTENPGKVQSPIQKSGISSILYYKKLWGYESNSKLSKNPDCPYAPFHQFLDPSPLVRFCTFSNHPPEGMYFQVICYIDDTMLWWWLRWWHNAMLMT